MQQKITFSNSRSLSLSGILHIPKKKTSKLVIIAHGFAANKDRYRFIKLSNRLIDYNIAAFRFDFGGCGSSENRPITLDYQIDDLQSALKYVQSLGYYNLGVVGESLGGLTTLLAYQANMKALVLWAPVTKSKQPSILRGNDLRQTLKDQGFIIYHKEGRKFKIPKQYFQERLNINQKQLLSHIHSPTLIIHGDKDNTIPLSHSQEAISLLPLQSNKLIVIHGANHTFDNYLEKLISFSVSWFQKYL